MVFSSQTFLFYFLPLVLLLYAAVPRSRRNLALLVPSLIFYLWGAGGLVGVLLLSIVGNWWVGRALGRGANPRVCVTASLVLNGAILGYFKYANFFVDQVNAAGARVFGFGGFEVAAVALPIGISFYTFQATSYVIDVARGRTQPVSEFVDFALYVASFPQLIAGPIVRFHEVAPQLRSRPFDWGHVSSGAVRFSHGLVKKVLIADSVAVVADAAFAEPTTLTTVAAWLGLLAYTIQIYFDFSGYSDMAIGLGRMFGFRFPENFRRPYSAVSVTDFWRRWHITLSAWFRDYVYIPLGGSRKGAGRTYVNLVTIFLITGLWHGAGWTFVCWGLYHGAWLVFERVAGLRDVGGAGHQVLRRVCTFAIVSVGWVPFRADSLGAAMDYFGVLFGWGVGGTEGLENALGASALVALAVGALLPFLPGRISAGCTLDEAETWRVGAWRLALALLALPVALALVVSGTFSPFLYFRF